MEEDIQKPEWYIIVTPTGKENVVQRQLLNFIENNGLQDQLFDVRILMEETVEQTKTGKIKVKQTKRFPNYIYIKMIYSDELYVFIKNISYVSGFLPMTGKPQPVSKEQVRKLCLEPAEPQSVNFDVGDEVGIVAGPLMGYTGTIAELNKAAGKARVNIEMFGRKTDVEVEFIQISKATNQP